MSSPSPLLCFRLSQLLAFYLSTVEGLLGAGSQLAGNIISTSSLAVSRVSSAIHGVSV